jgi:hypothetical protein
MPGTLPDTKRWMLSSICKTNAGIVLPELTTMGHADYHGRLRMALVTAESL